MDLLDLKLKTMQNTRFLGFLARFEPGNGHFAAPKSCLTPCLGSQGSVRSDSVIGLRVGATAGFDDRVARPCPAWVHLRRVGHAEEDALPACFSAVSLLKRTFQGLKWLKWLKSCGRKKGKDRLDKRGS